MSVAGKAMVRPSGKRGVMSSGKAGVHASDEDCCQCNTCDDVLFPCEITLVHIDENRCEDDIFDIFVRNPGTGAQRFIQQIDLKSSPPGCCDPITPWQERLVALVSKLRVPEDRGVGDTLERLLAKVGGRKIKHLLRLANLPCRCDDRQKWLNERFPYE